MATRSETTNLYPEVILPYLNDVKNCIQEATLFDGKLKDLINHVDILNGKMIRPAILLLTAKGLGKVRHEHIKAAAALEMVHNASLIHDDIIDQASVRRDRKSLNQKLGNSAAVLLGDLLITRSMGILQEIQNKTILPSVTQTVSEMCLAELLQNQSLFKFNFTESDYIEIIQGKTASLFELSFKLAAMISSCRQEQTHRLAEAGLNFGTAYQIIDDCNDMFSDDTQKLSDIKQGIITLPMIRLFESNASSKKTIIDSIENQDYKMLEKILLASDAKQYSLQLAKSYIEKGIACLDSIHDETTKQSIISIFKEQAAI